MSTPTRPAGRPTTALTWLLAPATDKVPFGHAPAAAAVRVLVGLLWLYNVAWKRPPDFGESSGKGLYGFTKDAVLHPVFPPYSWVVEHLVLPNFAVFGWAVLAAETALAVLLLTGAFVRVAALLGIAQSLAIGLSVAETPGEWPWSYWLMIGVHVALLFSAAGAVLAVDALRSRYPVPGGRSRLALVWGGLVAVAALVAVLLSLGEPVLAASGAQLGGSGLSVSLGSYNLVGALVLLLTGLALAASARTGDGRLAVGAAALAVLAALSLVVQNTFTDPWLGGNNTSAAFFLCVAVVGLVTWHAGRGKA